MGNVCVQEETIEVTDKPEYGISPSDDVSNPAKKKRAKDKKKVTTKNESISEQKSLKETADDFRVQNIFSHEVVIDDNFVPPVHKKTKNQKKLIIEATKECLIFSDLEEDALDMIVDAMEKFSAVKNEKIIRQGEIGDYFYVIERGSVEFRVDGKKEGRAESGQCFGELALMHDSPRAATCKAVSPGFTDLWRVHQDVFRQVIALSERNNQAGTISVLKKVVLFENLDKLYLKKIADALIDEDFKKDDVIMKKGEKGKVFYIVKEGIVMLTDIGHGESKYDDQERTVGSFFGERALITGDFRAANAICKTDCTLMTLSAENFMTLLGPYEDLMEETLCRKLLLSIPMITRSNPTNDELSILLSKKYMKSLSFKRGVCISRENESPDDPALYIIRQGSVKVSNRTEEKKLYVGDYFGDTAVATGSSKYTIEAMGDDGDTPTICNLVKASALKEVLGEKRRLVSVNIEEESSKSLLTLRDETAIFSNLDKKKLLGTGTFGKVWLVKHKESGAAYALKIQSKYKIIKMQQAKGIVREKNIMKEIDHPFIISLVHSFQDEANLYLVLMLYPGGELYSMVHQKKTDGIVKSAAQFYGAVILEALDFLHRNNIVYRDLKPENVMLDADGYCVLVDLGFAKKIEDKTFTLCGTPLYIAPEVILSRGHNKAADIWSFGILIYEMIYGITPFFKKNIDQMTLFTAVVKGKFKFPSHINDADTEDIVKRILHRRPPYRLGCLRDGADDIRNHIFFKQINFSKLNKKDIKSPWKPKMTNAFDTRYFEDWSHLEDDETPKKLNKKKQDLFKDY